MKTITKSDLACKISKEIGLSNAACEDLVSEIFTSLLDVVVDTQHLHIKNFGSFKIFNKKSRPGRDISKNKEITIEEKRVIRFSASRNLRNSLNNRDLPK